MNIKSDIEIAQEHTPKKITEVAATAGIDEKFLELYGNYKAKVDIRSLKDLPRQSKLRARVRPPLRWAWQMR